MKSRKAALIIFCTLLCVFSSQFSHAQLDMGIKVAFSADNTLSEINYVHDKSGFVDNSITLNSTSNSKYVGVFTHAKFGYLFLQSDLMYNQVDYFYTWANFIDGNNPYDNYEEHFKYLDISAYSGLNIGIARIGTGPIAHFLMSYDTDLKSMDFYESDFKTVSFGWRFGAGVSFSRFHLDLKYETDFNKIGDHMMFFGEKQKFDNKLSRFVFSLGVAL